MQEASKQTPLQGRGGSLQARLARRLRWFGWREFLALLGVAGMVTGAVAVFETANEAGAAALITVSAACVALAALWSRLKSVEAGGVKLDLIEVAQQLLTAAKEADLKGDSAEAARLRSEAEELLALASPLAATYESERARLPPGPQRTARLEEIVDEAGTSARLARAEGRPLDREAVKDLFGSGRAGNRVSALAFMQGDPDLVEPRLILGALAAPLSPFEETQAFKVAEAISSSASLDPRLARQLLDAASEALADGHLRNSNSRRRSAMAIVETLGPKDPVN